jgi:hypothetical protein
MTNDELLEYAVCGNKTAFDFISLLFDIFHFYDDVADKDKPLSQDDVCKSLWDTLIILPRNQFYANNFIEFTPLIAIAIQNWGIANKLEAFPQDDFKLQIAYIIRSNYLDILIKAATLCGGFEHGMDVAYKARLLWHDETFDGYKENLQKQFTDAEKLRS